MDKNTLTGLGLMALIWVGYYLYSKPTAEEIAAQVDFYNLLASQNGDLLLTQDEKQLLLNLRRYLTTQDGTFLATEQDDVLLLN